MALTLEQFGKALAASGLMTPEDVRAFWNAIPAAERPKDAEGFAERLRAQKLLTEFQAKQLLAGRGASLVMGDYAVLAEIGAGGMGQVYKARHRRMERIVALKVMSSAAMKDEAAVKRFQREVRAAARLEHPNIVTAYDSGEAGNVKYLVMQFVDGGDLSDLVKKNGPLPIEKAADYVIQAARGLAFAHAEGVIHRDIKPANLLLDKKGVVKILDMGLARIESSDDGLTATEQVMGTVDYMSPEQAANTKGADGRADIYSLGCTLWYLLTGKKAYEADTMIARLMAHREAPLPSLVKTRDDAPWALEQALHKMLAKRPQDRFQTMDEVVTALEPFSGGGSSKAGMGSSIGMGTQANAELAAFFQNVGPKTAGPGTKTGGSKTEAEPKSATAAGIDATAAFLKPEADTDPKSQLLSGAPLVSRVAPISRDAKQSAPARKKNPPVKLIAGGVLGVALLVVAGIIIKVRDKDGNVVAELNVPNGATVEVSPTAPAATTPAPIAVAPAMAPSKLLEARDYVWTTPENLGPPVNTDRSQDRPTLTADELCLICVSQPTGTFSELVECVRPSIDAPFGPPKRLTGATGEKAPCLSGDGLTLIYASTEKSFGKHDLWIRRRASRTDDWSSPLHLLQEVNSPDEERSPSLSPDGLALLFASDRPGGMGKFDIWFARRKTPTSSFEKATNLDPRLNSPDDETEPTLLSDGQLLFRRNDDAYYLSFKAASGILSALPVEGLRGNDGWLSPDARRWYFSGMSPTASRDIWLTRRAPIESTAQSGGPSSFMSQKGALPPSGDYSLLFDGSNSVEIDSQIPYSTDACTMEAFVRPDAYAKNSVICALSEDARLGLDFTDGKKWLLNHHLDPYGHFLIESRDSAVLGRPVHVAGVYDKSEFRLYIDGKTVATRSTSGAVFKTARGSPYLGRGFHGLIDEVRFSKRVRYSADFKPPGRLESDAETLALYRFDEGAGYELQDSSGNGHHGFVTGAKWVRADGSPISSSGSWTYGAPKQLFNGTSLAGWSGDTALMSIENGVVVNDGKRGVVTAPGEYRNFEVELDFRLAAVGNSGLGIFYPGDGDPAATGLEVQLLDDAGYPNVHPKQRCGSLYQVSAPTPGNYRAWPEWNHIVVRALGDQLEVVLNDVSILKVSKAELQSSNPAHAGLKRDSGKIALFPHTGRSEYRKIQVREATLGAPIAAPSPPAGGYALDFSASKGVWLKNLTRDANQPCTFELRATPRAVPLGIIFNTPLCSLGHLSLKQYTRASPPSSQWECVLTHDNKELTTLRLGPAVAGKTNHIAVVSTGKEILAFVDGKQVVRQAIRSPIRQLPGATIGRYADDPQWGPFPGWIDEVRFSKVARYEKDYVPQSRFDADADTLALYHFDEGSGDVIKDSSNNGHDGQIANAKWVRADGSPIAASPAEVVYLDDLPEKAWHGYQELWKHGQGIGGSIISRNGERIAHSLVLAPTRPGDLSFIEYELGGRYEKFEGLTYLTREPTDGPQTFRVLADGKKLWESPPQTLPNVEADFSLSIKGVNLLRLEVAGIPSFSHPLWLEPRLTPIAGAAAVPAATADHALQFDGKSAHVVLPLTQDVDTPLTIEATLLPGPCKSAVVSNSEGRGIGIDLDKGAANSLISRELNGVEGYVRATAPQPLDTSLPHRLAAVYDGTKLRLFVDGKLQATTELKGKYLPSSLPFIIGASPEGTGIDYPFTGTIDEVRISKSARYTQDYVPTPRLEADADTLALYHFDEGSGDVLRDSSGNGRDGKIVGAKWVRGGGSASAGATRNALQLNGAGYVDLASDWNYDGSDLTFEAWLISDTPRSMNTFLAVDHDAGGRRHAVRLSRRGDLRIIEVARPSDQLIRRFDDTLPSGRPTHFAAVWQGPEIRVYVDGKRLTSRPHQYPFLPRPSKPYAWLGGMPADESLVKAQQACEATLLETRITSRARYNDDFTPPAQLMADADTVSHFQCDEGAGDVLRDSSGNGRDGKIVGATWVRGEVPPSAVVSNSGGGLDLSAKLNPGAARVGLPQFLDREKPITVEMVVTPRSIPGTAAKNRKLWQFEFFDLKQYGDQWEWLANIYGDDGKRLPALTARGAVQPGKRAHLAGVWTGKELRFFVDGRLTGSTTVTKLPAPLTYNSHAIGGKHQDSVDYGPFDGILHEARISQTARYDRDYVPADRLEADANTAALYRCDEGSGDVLRDLAGHGHDGRIIGATWVGATPAAAKVAAAPALFNGTDLAGWKGDPKVWTWQSGELVGKLSSNGYTFLAGTKPYQDFELTYEVKLQGDQANSGVQFRSEMLPPSPYDMTGPQCEIGGTGKTGYGGLWWEKGAANGVKSAVPPEKYGPLVKPDDYNRMTVRCVGKHVTITLNGTTTVDGDFDLPEQGLLGFQLVSRGAPVEARVRNVTFRDLSQQAASAAQFPNPVAGGNNALALDETTTGVTVPRLRYDGSHPLTIEAWTEPRQALPAGQARSRHIVMHPLLQLNHEPRDGYWQLQSQTETTKYYFSERVRDEPAPGLVHVAAVLADGMLECFIDGKLRLVEPLDSRLLVPPLVPQIGNDVFYVGCGPEGSPTDFEGVIDEVRISRTARYSDDFTPAPRFEPDADTLALFHFDEGAGTAAADASGNGYHLQLKGHPIYGGAAGWCAAPAPRAADPKAKPERTTFGDAVEGTFGGHRYLLVRSKAVWNVAKAAAEARGGHLASITSAEENNWLKDVLLQSQPLERIVWIGATRPDRSQPWSWHGGDPWAFSDWREKEGSDGEAGAMTYSRPLDGSEARRGWGDWGSNNPPMALSGEIQGRTRAWGYVIEWDNSEPRETKIPSVAAAANDGNASELRKTPAVAAAQPFDLLANIKIPADVRLGNWRMVDGVLYTPPQENGVIKAALYLSPDRPLPEEYDVELVVARKETSGTGMVFGFVMGGRQATTMLDSYSNPPLWGIDDIDGKNLRAGNPTKNPGMRLPLDQRKTVRIEVRRGGVRVFVEAEKVVDWQGRPEQLSTNFWNVEKKQSLFLGSQARFHVHKLTLTPR